MPASLCTAFSMPLYSMVYFLYRFKPMADINTTYNYHRQTPIDLMNEYTICESLSDTNSAYMEALETRRPYGAMVGDFLAENTLLGKGSRIIEIGPGYASLMQGLLSSYHDCIRHVFMIDLSRDLIKRQRTTLNRWEDMITSIQGDIHELIHSIKSVDLIIINEVIGDLDTLTGLDPDSLPDEAAGLIKDYGLEIPSRGPFNLNIGAIRLVESICKKSIPAFITEHSCDPIIPRDMEYLAKGLALDSFPREISLFGHSEYTIRFSHLEKTAKAHGKKVSTGALTDLVHLKKSHALKFIFTSRACSTEKQEAIYELLDHIREYRWLVIR